jgi:hypothetical protein
MPPERIDISYNFYDRATGKLSEGIPSKSEVDPALEIGVTFVPDLPDADIASARIVQRRSRARAAPEVSTPLLQRYPATIEVGRDENEGAEKENGGGCSRDDDDAVGCLPRDKDRCVGVHPFSAQSKESDMSWVDYAMEVTACALCACEDAAA